MVVDVGVIMVVHVGDVEEDEAGDMERDVVPGWRTWYTSDAQQHLRKCQRERESGKIPRGWESKSGRRPAREDDHGAFLDHRGGYY